MGVGLGGTGRQRRRRHAVDGLSYLAVRRARRCWPSTAADGHRRVDVAGAGRRSSGSASTTRCWRTPVRVVDVCVGHLRRVVGHGRARASAIFLVVAAAFGGVRVAGGRCWCLPVGVLAGLAFAAPVTAFSSRLENDTRLQHRVPVRLRRCSCSPAPSSRQPAAGRLQPLAWVTPLWHGVELCRDRPSAPAALGGVGCWPRRRAAGLRRGRLGAGPARLHRGGWCRERRRHATPAVARRCPIPAGAGPRAGTVRRAQHRRLPAAAWLTAADRVRSSRSSSCSRSASALGALVGDVTTDGGTTVPYAVVRRPGAARRRRR